MTGTLQAAARAASTDESKLDFAFLYERAFHESPLGMAMITQDQRLLAINAALCQLLGYSPDELQSRTSDDITHPEDISMANLLAARAFNGELAHYQLDQRLLHKTGQSIRVRLNASLLRDAASQPVCTMAIVQPLDEKPARGKTAPPTNKSASKTGQNDELDRIRRAMFDK